MKVLSREINPSCTRENSLLTLKFSAERGAVGTFDWLSRQL